MRKERLADSALREAVQRAESGLIDADLGGGVIKQRVARKGQGKSGGFRTIILYHAAGRAFFVYGFSKSERDNIDDDEEVQFKKAAAHVSGLTDKQLAELIGKNQFSEVHENGEEVSK